jgi:hypothetical protein
MIGFVECVASPVLVLSANGHSAAHIMSIISAPAAAARRSPAPAMTAMPIAPRPSMNSQSAHQVPAQAWNIDSNGPTCTLLRKPLVGEPPLIQAPFAGVA